mmetsp:Transcript_21607/g.69766  ORF Transcript_21607/g.69766 Transcript_21607/m.69766 type:complete len:255 (-) Transcript_21607:375-1139(-)
MPYATPKYQVQAEECELATSRVASPTAWARPGLPPSFIVARPSAFNPRSAHHRPSPKQKTETSAQLHGSSVVGPGLTLGCCGLARRARATQDVEVHSLRLQYGAYRYWPTKPLPPLPLPPWPRPFPTGGCGCAATRAAPLRTRPSYNRTSVVLPSDTCQDSSRGWGLTVKPYGSSASFITSSVSCDPSPPVSSVMSLSEMRTTSTPSSDVMVSLPSTRILRFRRIAILPRASAGAAMCANVHASPLRHLPFRKA